MTTGHVTTNFGTSRIKHNTKSFRDEKNLSYITYKKENQWH